MSSAQSRDGKLDVPMIDLTPLCEDDEGNLRILAAEVDRAARTVGFMQVVGHGIPDQTIAGLARAMDGFFGLPMWQKKALRPGSTDLNRGYTPPKAERLSLSLGVDSPADLFEAFNVGQSAEDFPGLHLDDVQYGPNLWPLRPESFEPAVTRYFEQAARVAREITQVMALALGLDQHYFESFQDHSLDVLRLNHYPRPAEPVVLEPGQAGMGAHTDYGIVTVLWADQVPGLQILDTEGVWHDVQPAEGALLVNLGDLLARWTNDRWISTLHRVVPPADAEGAPLRRRSAAFFHDGNADAVISTLPGCTSETDPSHYDSVTVSDHLSAKLAGSRGLVANTAAERESARLLSSQN